ncbi:hypothetical protein [Mycobacterium sp.]|uniref:hypothetical protein n=1 Tax=Mycobacterium sp. TaxID=1785 RepID=UPI003BAA6DBD
MTAPGRFAQDTDAQAVYVRHFNLLVDRTGKNILSFQQHVDESAQFFQGQAALAFQHYQAKVHMKCRQALQRLQQIAETLHTGLGQTLGQDEQGAAAFNQGDIAGGSFFTTAVT